MIVKCAICNTEHKSIHDESKQGVNCASNTVEHEGSWYLWAHYGSDHDSRLYRFVQTPPESGQNADPVCDVCIKILVDSNWLELINEDVPWVLPWQNEEDFGLFRYKPPEDK